MKFDSVLDTATAASLRLDWLTAELEPVTDYGRRFFAALPPMAPGEERAASDQARRTVAFAQTVSSSRIDAIRDAMRGAPDVGSAIARASMGDVLSDVNFLEVQRFCDALARVDTLLGEAGPCRVPRCDAVATALERGRSGKFGFYLEDAFDVKLAHARRDLAGAQAEFERAKAALGRETDEFIIMREDLAGALPPGVRVIREAPTYFLCEVELDAAALSALGKRDAAARRLAEMEEEVRRRLSAVVREHSAALDEATVALGSADCFIAAARFTQRYACVAAEYLDGKFEFEDGHFLPVRSELERRGLTYTPISLQLPTVAVLTGPNMGGKSVALRTCGFIAVCAAFGLPVPATRASVPLFAQIAWLGIGVREEEGGLLSSFASEVVRLRDIMQVEGSAGLWLIDEFARTTTPHEGRALLLALIAAIQKRGTRAFVATHLWEIAETAGVPHYAVRGLREIPQASPENLVQALANLARSMDYTIESRTGERGGQADAIALAGLLGLDRALVQSAWQMLAGGES